MLPRLLLPLIFALAAAAPAQAAWSQPQRVGSARTGAAALAFSPSGTAWAAWGRGRFTRAGRLGGTGRRLAPFDQIVGHGGDGVAMLADEGAELRLRRGLRGRWQTIARRHDPLHGPFLLSGPGGRVAVVWSDFERRPRSENAYLLRAVFAGRRGRPSRPQTIARVLGGVGNAGTDVAVDFGPRGELVAVFERRERRGYGLWTRTRDARGRLSRVRRVGTSHGNSRVAIDAGRGGRLVVGWSSEDGGEERNLPRVYRAAIRTRSGARFRVRRVDAAHQQAFEYPEWVAATLDAAGAGAVVWSSERRADRETVEFPIRAVTIGRDGGFGPVQTLGGAGEVVGAVPTADGVTVAWITTAYDEESGLTAPGQVATATRAAGADAFGAPEPVSADRFYTARLFADPSTGAAWVVAARRDGVLAFRRTG